MNDAKRVWRIALASITAALTIVLNSFSGGFSIALPPYYVSFRFSTPLHFIVVLVDPVAGLLGASFGNFLYDVMMGRGYSAVVTGLFGTFVATGAFYLFSIMRGCITLLNLLIGCIAAAVLRSLVVAASHAIFLGRAFLAVFYGTLIGTLFSNVILSLLILSVALPMLKEHVRFPIKLIKIK